MTTSCMCQHPRCHRPGVSPRRHHKSVVTQVSSPMCRHQDVTCACLQWHALSFMSLMPWRLHCRYKLYMTFGKYNSNPSAQAQREHIQKVGNSVLARLPFVIIVFVSALRLIVFIVVSLGLGTSSHVGSCRCMFFRPVFVSSDVQTTA